MLLTSLTLSLGQYSQAQAASLFSLYDNKKAKKIKFFG